jgi:prepilin-type N-terminal cleavage/methylation domain-containing protein
MPIMKRLKDDKGITLIELIVAVVLLGVFLTVLSSLYVNALNVVSMGRSITANTKSASNAMRETTRVIRAGTENPLVPPAVNAPAFVIAKPDDIVMYAYINLESAEEKPQMIRLRVDRTTGNLIESRWPATPASGGRWTFPTNPCESTNVPAGCTAPTTRSTIAATIPATNVKVFQFLAKDGTAITVPTAGLSEDDRRLVSSVKVTITTQASLTNAKNSVTVENTVGMPNLGFAETSP